MKQFLKSLSRVKLTGLTLFHSTCQTKITILSWFAWLNPYAVIFFPIKKQKETFSRNSDKLFIQFHSKNTFIWVCNYTALIWPYILINSNTIIYHLLLSVCYSSGKKLKIQNSQTKIVKYNSSLKIWLDAQYLTKVCRHWFFLKNVYNSVSSAH